MDINNELSDVDDFDEWEDVQLDLDDYQYNIEFSTESKKDSINKSLELAKLTKQYKLAYFQQSINVHKIQAAFSVIYLKKLVLSNCYKNIKIKKILPSLIRKKFSNKIYDFDKLKTLIKGLIYWFEKNYQIDTPGQRPIDKNLIKDSVFKNWFREHENNLKEFHKEKKQIFKTLKNYYKLASPEFKLDEKTFGKFPKINQDLKDTKNNTKEEYVFKFYLLLKELLSNNDQVNVKLIYNVPCLDCNGVINSCATKSLLSLLKQNSLDEPLPNIQRSLDYDLYFPYMWLELHWKDEQICYLNPLKFGDLTDFIYQLKQDEPFKKFIQFDKVTPFDFECPYYIFSIDDDLNVVNVSPRYIPNLQYSIKPCLINLKNEISWNINKTVWKIFENVFSDFYINTRSENLTEIVKSHMLIPQQLKMYKRHPNFVIDNFSCYRTFLEIPVGNPIGKLIHNKTIHNVYFRSQLKRLRTKTHWQVLGRDAIEYEKPRKYKTYRSSKDSYHSKSTVPLFTFDQTILTPRIKNLPNLKDYRKILKGNEMLKIFNESTMLPESYRLLENNDEKKTHINRKLINQFNKRKFKNRIDYLEVITGFKFLPKDQVKPITKLMISKKDYEHLICYYHDIKEKEQLSNWNELLLRLDIKERIDPKMNI